MLALFWQHSFWVIRPYPLACPCLIKPDEASCQLNSRLNETPVSHVYFYYRFESAAVACVKCSEITTSTHWLKKQKGSTRSMMLSPAPCNHWPTLDKISSSSQIQARPPLKTACLAGSGAVLSTLGSLASWGHTFIRCPEGSAKHSSAFSVSVRIGLFPYL